MQIRLMANALFLLFLSACTTTSSQNPQTAASLGNRITYDDLPVSVRSNYDLGANYIRSAEYDAAEDRLMKVVSAMPKFPDTYNALGFLQEQRGKKSEAISLYAKAVSLDPHYSDAFINYARIQCKEGDTGAADQLAQIAGGAQANIRAGIYAGAAGCALTNLQFDKASAFADQAIAADGRYAEAYFYKAQALEHLGSYVQVFDVLNSFHDLKGYTPYSVGIGVRSAKAVNNQIELKKYNDVIARYSR